MNTPSAAKSEKNLTGRVTEELRSRVQLEKYLPGEKLPTEKALIAELGVSRTVLREAIAGLKVEGVLKSRQGAGVFVTKHATDKSDNTLPGKPPLTISDVIEFLEIRASIEIGAAELAAERCSPAQEADILDCFNQFKQRVQSGENSEREDYEFHLAIARATNNPRFVEFLSNIGCQSIPRSRLRSEANVAYDRKLEHRILREHKKIMDAILDHDPESARRAMRLHLVKGADRYRSLVRQVQSK